MAFEMPQSRQGYKEMRREVLGYEHDLATRLADADEDPRYLWQRDMIDSCWDVLHEYEKQWNIQAGEYADFDEEQRAWFRQRDSGFDRRTVQ